ncbi:MAG: hypothetical protein QXU40_02965 [Candidatus Pacearchaeota archaeon]
MGAVETIIELKKQGMSEPQIIEELKEMGLSPKDIKESLERAKIKTAITGEEVEEELEPSIMTQKEENEEEPNENTGWVEEFAPPIPSQKNTQKFTQTKKTRTVELEPREQYYEEEGPVPQTYTQVSEEPLQPQYYPEEYSQQAYPQEYLQQTTDIDSIIEISEQVFSEKIKKIEKQIEEIKEFKIIVSPQIESISNRLKKIETIIDKLQIEILEKIGSYGANIEMIKKEMSMIEDSFGKVASALTEKKESKKTKKRETP